MKNLREIATQAILRVSLVLSVMLLSHCPMEDNGSHAEIYPKNGSTNVPVNPIIEVQFGPDLGITNDQMKPKLFSIRECEPAIFEYLNPQQNTTNTTTPATNNSTTASTDPNKKTDGSNTSTTTNTNQNSNTNNNNKTKYKADIHFYSTHRADATKRVFNYLVINPEGRDTPLKPNTTYCVKVGKLKNAKGTWIDEKEISFTTEEDQSIGFDTQLNPEFFGKRITMAAKDSKGDPARDFVIINLRNQSVRPDQLKSKITICQVGGEKDTSVAACKDVGKEVPSDVYLMENLFSDPTEIIPSYYGMYAVAPRQDLVSGQQYRVVVDTDLDKNQEANIGLKWADFSVDDQPSLNWQDVIKTQIIDSNGQALKIDNCKNFYVGSGN